MKDEVYLKKLGKKIAKLRKSKGVSQRKMAKLLETSNTQLRRIETGEVNASINGLRRIAFEFDISLCELVDIK